jgi:GNAT superfamily N-acetyltransferase
MSGTRTTPPTSVIRLDAGNWARQRDAIVRIEAMSYEPARRDSPETLEALAHDPRGACYVATVAGAVIGFCLGGPLESFADVGGVTADPAYGLGVALYAADLTVTHAHRGRRIARTLKHAQLDLARELGYRVVAGRNRVGLADAMWRLNVSLGAREIARIVDAYPDGPEPREALYYHIEL